MATSPHVYPNGIGGSSGDEIVTEEPLYLLTGGRILYLHSGTGVDAGGTAGRQRERPLATMAQAYANASEGDFIVCLAGHAEIVTAALTINKASLVIVSEGTGSSRARFTAAVVGGIMWDITAHSVQVRNCYFPASTVAPTGTSFQVRGIGNVVKDCYFECGALDTVPRVRLAAGVGHTRFDGTSFVATASQPATAIEALVSMNGLTLRNCTFEGASFGWSSYAILGTSAVSGVRGEGVNMLGGSDAYFNTGSTGFWYAGASGGSTILEQTA